MGLFAIQASEYDLLYMIISSRIIGYNRLLIIIDYQQSYLTKCNLYFEFHYAFRVFFFLLKQRWWWWNLQNYSCFIKKQLKKKVIK